MRLKSCKVKDPRGKSTPLFERPTHTKRIYRIFHQGFSREESGEADGSHDTYSGGRSVSMESMGEVKSGGV